LPTGTCFVRMHRRWLHKLCVGVIKCLRMIVHILILLRHPTFCTLWFLLPHSVDACPRVNVIINGPIRAFSPVGEGTWHFLKTWIE
jgi:hypothetical protein